jgi:CBS domain containing-hemolysin-like protein
MPIAAVFLLLALACVLTVAEASVSLITPAHASALRSQHRRGAALLERITSDPTRYVHAVSLAVLGAQNGALVVVAVIADRRLGGAGAAGVAVLFTLAYFVLVDAVAQRLARVHRESLAMLLAPCVWLVGRTLWYPARALMGLANGCAPVRGLHHGPLLIEQEIRSLAEVGHKEGAIEEHERAMIHSVFQLGDRSVRDIMVPRPDIVAIDIAQPLTAAADTILRHGVTRLPAYRGDLDHIEGIVHAMDVLGLVHQGRHDVALTTIARPARFVSDSARLALLLHDMREDQSHLVIASDEYGMVSGLVTLTDVLEELVGRISDEHHGEAPDVTPIGDGRYRVNAALPIAELNQLLGVELPHAQWNTVGGLVFGLAGTIPAEGATVETGNLRFTVERVHRHRIITVLVTQLPAAGQAATATRTQ